MEAIDNHQEGDQMENQAASSNSNDNKAMEPEPVSLELEGVLFRHELIEIPEAPSGHGHRTKHPFQTGRSGYRGLLA
ncbi:hypothetical protein Vadar_025890 [Vaccinium darrowii]|uniref:Uncharacterized protein n=1 Tax=Vaccinium darrowii TaxID=229202 RepID=A0ACB7XCI9_9ERIC|nr:hypothetical protein Vadar_025890 [Vaccinium darrowii]